MASNNKRRETTRRQLEQRLQERQQREASRKRAVLIGSVSGTVVVIAVVLILVFTVFDNGSDKKNNQAGGNGGAKPTPTTSATAPASSAAPTPSASTYPTDTPCKVTRPKGSVVFQGVTIANPTNLAKNPDVTSCSKTAPKTLAYKDLVVGKGKAPTATSTVSVQYAGVFDSDGYAFDSSWKDTPGKPTSFPLNQVVKGFTYGIAGQGKIPPMKIGGRRVVILPSSLAYGPSANNGIPANTPLVFVIDLKSIS